MMGLIYFHSVDNYRSLCPSLQLMELVRGEDVKQCNLNAMNYVSLVLRVFAAIDEFLC